MKTTPFQKALLGLFLAGIFFACSNELGEPDPFFHVKAGEWIWRTKSIPRTDVFSYTAFGKAWIAHEWLAEVVFYGVYARLGFWGLILFSAALAALAHLLAYLAAVDRGADPTVAALLLPLGGRLGFSFWMPRPQVFSFLALAAVLWILGRRSERPGRGPAAIALVFLAWANLHGGFVVGLGVLILFLLLELSAKSWPGAFPRGYRRERFRFLLGSCALAALASLANPHGWRAWTYIFRVLPATRALGVFEWQSILGWRQPSARAFVAELSAVAALAAYWRGARRESRDAEQLVLVLLFSTLPLVSLRHAGFWPIAALPPLALAATEALRRPLRRIPPRAFGGFAVAAGLAFLAGGALAFPREYFNPCCVPVHAAEFIEAKGLAGPLFNHYNDGGYLIFRFWPGEKVFMDGRSDVYGPAEIRDYEAILNAGPGWEELVDRKYGINYFLLDYRPSPVLEAVRPLCGKLLRGKWALVYWDDASLIFVRDAPRNSGLIRDCALRLASPLRDPATFSPGEREAAAREAASALARSPHSIVVAAYLQALRGPGGGGRAPRASDAFRPKML